MQVAYEARDAIDAQRIVDLLVSERIAAEVFGGFLTGAAGELPMAGLVRVMVADHDLDKARALIEREHEATAHLRTEPSLPETSGKRNVFAGAAIWPALIGAVGGALTMYLVLQIPAPVEGADYNNDDVADETLVLANGEIREIRGDRNLDGKIDTQVYYSDGGGALYQDDDDFDGRFESRTYMRNDLVWRSERDLPADVLQRCDYDRGVLLSCEHLVGAERHVLKREHYRGGWLHHDEVDLNRDGRLETTREFDALGEVVRTETRH